MLITANGFSISMLTEWIENPTGDYDKQDCERKAFRRLAAKLKQAFPRLPLVILADGLYPFEGFFAICKANQWAYVITFKPGNLKTVWEEMEALKSFQIDNKHQEIRYLPNDKKIEQIYRWVDKIDYHGYQLNWLECRETVIEPEKNEANKTTVFVHITDLALNKKNIANTSINGRLRWKIENEGFNALKTGGYAMEHKWARKSYLAMKNYFQFMQIAHLINQLMVNSVIFQQTYLKAKNHPTLKSLWQDLIAAMAWGKVKSQRLEKIRLTRIHNAMLLEYKGDISLQIEVVLH